MRKSAFIVGTIACALIGGASLFARQDEAPMPAPAQPTHEHQWLKQFVGEWDVKSEMKFAPDQPAIQGEGTESVRAVGEFWILSELKGEMPGGGAMMSAFMTVGFDPEKNIFVGSWIDSVHPIFWNYTGSLDSTGKILTLEADGPNLLAPGTTAKYRDVTEFKSKDERVLTSSMQGPDGKWQTFMTATYTRSKK